MKNVSVSGIGKAGLPLACVIADNGYRVIGVGRNREKVDRLNKGINPIPEETGLSKLLKKNITRNLTFSKNAADGGIGRAMPPTVISCSSRCRPAIPRPTDFLTRPGR